MAAVAPTIVLALLFYDLSIERADYLSSNLLPLA